MTKHRPAPLKLKLYALALVSVFVNGLSRFFQQQVSTDNALHSRSISRSLAPPPVGNNVKRKPKLIVHLGPHKTASTTIQWILDKNSDWQPELLKDNVHAMISDTHRFFDPACHQEMSQARQRAAAQESSASLFDIISRIPCARKIRDTVLEMANYKDTQMDNDSSPSPTVVISDETRATLNKLFQVYGIDHDVCVDWIGLKALFYDWDVSSIFVYRRFFEWSPSAKQQQKRWTPSKPRMNMWPSKGGLVIQPLLADFQNFKNEYSYTTDLVEEMESAGVPYKLLNMHDPNQSVVNSFFCDGLQTQASCESFRSMNKRKNPGVSHIYHAFVGEAELALKTRMNRHDRHDVELAAKTYWEVELNRTFQEFPLVCSSNEEIEIYKNVSLEFERRIVPEFYASPAGKDQHILAFQKAAKDKKFCKIHTRNALKLPAWKSFFSRYSNDRL